MHRDKKQLTVTGHILMFALAAGNIIEQVALFGQMRRHVYSELTEYYADRRLRATLHRLQRQGWIKYEYKEAKRILKLTRKGELEALLQKSKIVGPVREWDGKWRMVVFDIPENTREIRTKLRGLLKSFGFKALQASVYVYPFEINVNAIEFLRQSGLIRYIRFARIEAFDDDTDLRKLFRTMITKVNGRQK
jgi:DNA-binding transcriptional regulator PaaX